MSYSSGGQAARAVAVADVNRDGNLDLVATNECISSADCTTGSVSVLLGNGNGTFQAALSYASGGVTALSVAVGNFNADDEPDLAVVNACNSNDCTSGTVGVLLGNGDGTYQVVTSYASGGKSPSSVAAADLNGDGKPDLAVTNQCINNADCTSGSVSVLLGNGGGAYQAAVSYVSGGVFPFAVVAGDFNGDGKLDLAAANECTDDICANGSVGVLLGNGDGTYQTAVNYGSGGKDALS